MFFAPFVRSLRYDGANIMTTGGEKRRKGGGYHLSRRYIVQFQDITTKMREKRQEGGIIL